MPPKTALQGFSLTNYPAARKKQLEMREYALRNESTVFQLLQSSSDPKHRAIAARILGFAQRSDGQVDALIKACLDSDAGVRNNAIRALAVLAGAKPAAAQRIPAAPFIRL